MSKTFRNLGLAFFPLVLTSCSRAPSFDIFGSFFPAWLFCVLLGLLLTAATRQVFVRVHVVLAVPVLTYPCLTAMFTFAIWLLFFS